MIFRQKVVVATIFLLGIVGLVTSATVYAECSSAKDCIRQGADGVGSTGSSSSSVSDIARTISNILLFVLGSVAVVMIVVGGVRYATSNGDQAAVKSAKDTVLYSVIGLIVAIAAYAIVNFIIEQFVE